MPTNDANTDEARLEIAQRIVREAIDSAGQGVGELAYVNRTQLIALIQVALGTAYTDGRANPLGRIPGPMTLELAWRDNGWGRAVPFIVDDQGREVPNVRAIKTSDMVDEISEIIVTLIADSKRVGIRKSAGGDHGQG